MEFFPDLDIRFPDSKESELLSEMKRLAIGRWRWKSHNNFGGPAEDGYFYFHSDGAQPCTLCIHREGPGYLKVLGLFPDEGTVNPIPSEVCEEIIRDFDVYVASPAVEDLKGMTVMVTSHQTLEDHFPPKAVELLDRFCSTSNKGDLGRHLSDQDKWMDFLLYVFRNSDEPPYCDVFGSLLRERKWWPEEGIDSLVSEYDFAMRLLARADQPN